MAIADRSASGGDWYASRSAPVCQPEVSGVPVPFLRGEGTRSTLRKFFELRNGTIIRQYSRCRIYCGAAAEFANVANLAAGETFVSPRRKAIRGALLV